MLTEASSVRQPETPGPTTTRVATQASTGHARLGFLDGIRGVAATMVVIHHVGVVSAAPGFVQAVVALGNPWVAIFITISGFCLYLPAARKEQVVMPRPFWTFMKRRAIRILPAWYASLALSAAVGGFFLSVGYRQPAHFLPQDFLDVATHLTLSHSMTRYSGSINGPGYTLGTEWQLYALLLPFLWLAKRWGWISLLLIVAVLALPFPSIVGKLIHKVFSPTFTVPFVLGVAGARWLYHSPYLRRVVAGHWVAMEIVLLRTIVLLGIVLFPIVNRYNHDVACWVIALATAVACINMAKQPDLLEAHLLSSRAGVTLGSFSYSLYLVHFPLLAVAAFVVYSAGLHPSEALHVVFLPFLPLIFCFAYLFHLIFERPFIGSRATVWPRFGHSQVARAWCSADGDLSVAAARLFGLYRPTMDRTGLAGRGSRRPLPSAGQSGHEPI